MSQWPGNSRHTKTTFGGLSRSELMSRIRSTRNATTELKLVTLFHAARVRGWRRNARLPGKPDFVFPKSKLAVFVDGCFWHGHACGRNLKPKRNAEAWRKKIEGNQSRDRRNARILRADGWRVVRIWECTLSNFPRMCIERIKHALIS